ncbi:MAG: hypothetical protein JXA73_10215 [Acidobacteria bacterium]|nr:hypothetical protein [Acidobacteriota bacterium]
MKRLGILLVGILSFAVSAYAEDLSAASPQDLLGVYKQLRTIAVGNEAALVENVVLRRDAATFTFVSGRMTFAAPIAGRVLAAQFQGEGKFELQPPTVLDKRQVSRFTGKAGVEDTFREAVFFFTDDTYAEFCKLMKIQAAPATGEKAMIPASQKQYIESYNGWIENQRKGNPVMRNLGARILADLTDSGSRGFFLADFKAKEAGDLLFHISWNRDSLLLPDAGRGEEVILLHLNPGNYYEWWSGFHLADEYAKSPHVDHRALLVSSPVTHIDLQVTKDNHISATVDMEYVVAEGSLRVLPFGLDGVLRISSIEDGSGNKLNFIQEDRKLDSDPWLILPAPARPGEKHKIKIAYSEDSTRDSRIVFQQGAGLYYVTSRTSWFPSFGAIDDRTQFQLHARSPKKFKFVASGTRLSSETVKDELITTWKGEIPFCVFGFNYGAFVESSQSSPNLTVTAYAGKEVPDELKQLEAEMSLLELAGASDVVNQSGILRGGFNTAANVKYAAGISNQAFKLFEFLYGPLPFKAVSVTEQPIRGYGQSWPNLIFLPYDSLLDATTRNSLGLQDSGGEREFYTIVAVHEMAHQWWGHLVGWKTYHDQWLSEGLAEHSSALYLRQFEPNKWSTYWDLRRTWLLSKNSSGYRPVDAGPIWLNDQLNDRYQGRNSGLIYYKGAYVLEMLRATMYDSKNADNRFLAMMRDYAKTYAGQNASTEDFQRIVEKHMGESMEWFFNQWVYGVEIPSYDFKYQLTDAGGGQTDLSMTITQSRVSENFRMRLPLQCVINGSSRHLGTIQIIGTKPYTVNIKLPVRPEKVILDGERSILAEIHQ